MKIVSLLPSATEMICALGLGEDLVGVTHECDFPPRVRGLPTVTRTLIPREATSREIDQLVRERLGSGEALYTLNAGTIEALRPDLIVTQTLCDVCAVAEEEVRATACALDNSPEIVSLEPETLEDVLDSLRTLGRAAGTMAAAEVVAQKLRERVEAVTRRTAEIRDRPKVALLEWLDPPFSSGHWGPELVRLAGGRELLGIERERSRRLEWKQVIAAEPEVLLVACCGFDLTRTLQDVPVLDSVPGWAATPAARNGRVCVVDGSRYFSRPGPRLVDSLEILAHALHPEHHPLPAGRPAALRLETPMPDPTLGLCAECVYRRTIATKRRSRFILCRRSESDPAFSRYPRLPMERCPGFEIRSPSPVHR